LRSYVSYVHQLRVSSLGSCMCSSEQTRMTQHTPAHVHLSVYSCTHIWHMFTKLRSSSLGSYMCSPFESVLSGSYGYPTTCTSIEGVLVWVHVEHVFSEEGVLSGSYVYVHRLRVSSRVHMGSKTSEHNICVFVYITYYIYIYTYI
jgi:hypothetical protein